MESFFGFLYHSCYIKRSIGGTAKIVVEFLKFRFTRNERIHNRRNMMLVIVVSV